MKVLVACEFSGIVREAFRRRGAVAFSCDLLDSEIPSEYHIKGDVLSILHHNWDLVIAHPPCTNLAVSGAWKFKEKRASGEQQKSIDFFMEFTKLKCKVLIENPVSIMSSVYRKPDQVIQPWQFGHGEMKRTCLWLFGLPKLKPTNIVPGSHTSCLNCSPSKDRWKIRSRTYQGIADAFAGQFTC